MSRWTAGRVSNAAKSSKMEDRRNQEEIFRPAGNISNSVVATQQFFGISNPKIGEDFHPF